MQITVSEPICTHFYIYLLQIINMKMFMRPGVQTVKMVKPLAANTYDNHNLIGKLLYTPEYKSHFSTGVVTAANKDKTIIHTEQRILGNNLNIIFKIERILVKVLIF